MSISAAFVKNHAEPHQDLSAMLRNRACRRWIVNGLSLMLALGWALPACAKNDSLPDWVKTAAAQTLPTYPADTNAVVLLDDTTFTVDPDGRAVEHVRRVVKILRPQGREDAIVHIPFDKDTKIVSMSVWSIGPDGHEYTMKDKEFNDIGLDGDAEIFQDDRFRVAEPPGADPGGVIAYEYEQRERPFVTEKTWEFQDEIPHLAQSFTLQLPAGYSFSTVWAHHAEVQAADLEHQRWRWELNQMPAVDLQRVPLSPAFDSLAGRMTVHYASPGVAAASVSTWKGIGEWYEPLLRDRIVATPEITAKAQELTSGKTDFYDKTEAIAEFVQKQVRYFAVEVGIGGYQPHAAGDIFQHRYGDCKDKATLVSAMLSAVGIHATLVMVDTHRGVVDPAAPSLTGNHMIAAIEVPKGYDSPRLHSMVTADTGRRYLIFDPTWDKTPFGQLEHELQGGYGILMEGADTQAIRLPVLDPALNTIHRTADFHLGADGVLKGVVTEKRFGDVSEERREVYQQGDAKEQTEYLDHVLERDFTGFSATDVKVENLEALNKEFTLTYSLSADRYAKTMGPLLMVRPRVLGDLALATDHKPRTVPINLGETLQDTDEYTIDLPEGYAVDEMPDPVKIDLGFAAYQSEIGVTGNTLHYKRTFTVREVTVPAERYADVQKLAGLIAADEESSAILKKK